MEVRSIYVKHCIARTNGKVAQVPEVFQRLQQKSALAHPVQLL